MPAAASGRRRLSWWGVLRRFGHTLSGRATRCGRFGDGGFFRGGGFETCSAEEVAVALGGVLRVAAEEADGLFEVTHGFIRARRVVASAALPAAGAGFVEGSLAEPVEGDVVVAAVVAKEAE